MKSTSHEYPETQNRARGIQSWSNTSSTKFYQNCNQRWQDDYTRNVHNWTEISLRRYTKKYAYLSYKINVPNNRRGTCKYGIE